MFIAILIFKIYKHKKICNYINIDISAFLFIYIILFGAIIFLFYLCGS